MYNRIRYLKTADCYVEFPYSRLRMSETPIMGNDGFTQEGVRYEFKVSGYVVGDDLGEFQGLLFKMRNVLAHPRGTFIVEWSEDNSTWQTYYSWEKGDDINFGPKPGQLNITEFVGGLAAVYDWSIEISAKECYPSCSASPNSTSNILSLSRSFTHTVDRNGFTTRRVTGTVVVTSAEALAIRGGDWWRELCLPILPINFHRDSQEFVVSRDQRTMDFSCVDKEQMWTLPKPVTSGQANYMVRQDGVGGLVTYSLSGRFEAPSTTSKRDILLAIADLVANRMTAEFVIWQSRSINEDVYGNSVAFDISWTAAGVSEDGNVADYSRFGAMPPGYNGGKAAMAGPYGSDGETATSGIIAHGLSLYDACQGGLGQLPNVTIKGADTRTSGEDPTTPRDDTGGGSGSEGQYPSSAHRSAPFIAYHERLCWVIDNHIVVFPSKKKGVKPVIQQTANPTCTLIQAGYASRQGTLDKIPTPAKPHYTTAEATMVKGNIEYRNPIPLAARNQFEQTVQWTYQMALNDTAANGDSDMAVRLEIQAPTDPRMTETEVRDDMPTPDIDFDIVVHPE